MTVRVCDSASDCNGSGLGAATQPDQTCAPTGQLPLPCPLPCMQTTSTAFGWQWPRWVGAHMYIFRAPRQTSSHGDVAHQEQPRTSLSNSNTVHGNDLVIGVASTTGSPFGVLCCVRVLLGSWQPHR